MDNEESQDIVWEVRKVLVIFNPQNPTMNFHPVNPLYTGALFPAGPRSAIGRAPDS